ncbi:MAG: BatD family protein [bacterium]
MKTCYFRKQRLAWIVRVFQAAILVVALGWTTARADAPKDQLGLKLEVDKRQVEVGDSLTLTVEFKQIGSGNGMQVEGPSVPTPENFDIGSTQSSTQIIESNGKLYQVSDTKIGLTATKPGQETLGPASLIYQDPKLGKREIQSNGVLVTVVPKKSFSFFGHSASPTATPGGGLTPTPTADDGLRDVKPLLPESFGIFKWLILFLLLVLIVGFIVRKRMTRSKAVVEPAMSDTDRWKDSLKQIFNEDLTSKELCLKLSQWARECLQTRFGFPAADYTTGEILKALRSVKTSVEVRESAEKCLRACDRVLYADGTIGSKDNLKSWASALVPKASRRK